MLTALIVFGLAGLAIKFAAILPPAWEPVTSQAHTAMIVSLAAAFVAAAIASMRSAWHAERAHQAGPGYRHVMYLALGYSITCIVIEVAIGKLGAMMIGLDVPVLALTALLVFFAIAPRIVAFILSGLDGLVRAEAKDADTIEHGRTLDRIRAVNEATSQRIQAGVSNLEQERKARAGSVHGSIALVGAAAALLGAGGDPASAQVEYPTVEASNAAPVATANAAPVATVDQASPAEYHRGELSMARGPRDRAKYNQMAALLDSHPNMSNHKLALAVNASRPAIKQWRAHFRAQQALAFAQNGALLDAA